MKNEKEIDVSMTQKMLTLFTLFFPSLLLLIPHANFTGSMMKILLVFYQFIVLNAFLNDHYDTK